MYVIGKRQGGERRGRGQERRGDGREGCQEGREPTGEYNTDLLYFYSLYFCSTDVDGDDRMAQQDTMTRHDQKAQHGMHLEFGYDLSRTQSSEQSIIIEESRIDEGDGSNR